MGETAGSVLAAAARRERASRRRPPDAERLRWAPVVAAGTVRCAVCHGLIDPAAPWNFGHGGTASAGRSPEHRRCNGVVGRGVPPAA
ncbi:MAG TPA: hypothetical protein VD814_11290 [Nocardioides sp.]|nr:hypothetical protein [Nocardioides sp.]